MKKSNQSFLFVSPEKASQIKEGDTVKLGAFCKNQTGIVVSKTDKLITVLVDDGCYDIQISAPGKIIKVGTRKPDVTK